MVGAGWASRARPPPFNTETCFLTVLISPIFAPLLRSSDVSFFRSASSIDAAGSASSADAPPEMRARSRSSSPSDSASSCTLRAASTLLSSGSGWEAKTVSKPSGPGSWPSLVATSPPEVFSPRSSSAAFAIARAARPSAGPQQRDRPRISPEGPRAQGHCNHLGVRRPVGLCLWWKEGRREVQRERFYPVQGGPVTGTVRAGGLSGLLGGRVLVARL